MRGMPGVAASSFKGMKGMPGYSGLPGMISYMYFIFSSCLIYVLYQEETEIEV